MDPALAVVTVAGFTVSRTRFPADDPAFIIRSNKNDRSVLGGCGDRTAGGAPMPSDQAMALPWYRSLNGDQWRVLVASNLGWLFDGFEIFALFLTVGFALTQLLDVAQAAAVPRYAGYILATTVFGWATGGVIGGIIADYIGRKRTMMLAILA
jgi:hypothetical protein